MNLAVVFKPRYMRVSMPRRVSDDWIRRRWRDAGRAADLSRRWNAGL